MQPSLTLTIIFNIAHSQAYIIHLKCTSRLVLHIQLALKFSTRLLLEYAACSPAQSREALRLRLELRGTQSCSLEESRSLGDHQCRSICRPTLAAAAAAATIKQTHDKTRRKTTEGDKLCLCRSCLKCYFNCNKLQLNNKLAMSSAPIVLLHLACRSFCLRPPKGRPL